MVVIAGSFRFCCHGRTGFLNKQSQWPATGWCGSAGCYLFICPEFISNFLAFLSLATVTALLSPSPCSSLLSQMNTWRGGNQEKPCCTAWLHPIHPLWNSQLLWDQCICKYPTGLVHGEVSIWMSDGLPVGAEPRRAGTCCREERRILLGNMST